MVHWFNSRLWVLMNFGRHRWSLFREKNGKQDAKNDNIQETRI